MSDVSLFVYPRCSPMFKLKRSDAESVFVEFVCGRTRLTAMLRANGSGDAEVVRLHGKNLTRQHTLHSFKFHPDRSVVSPE